MSKREATLCDKNCDLQAIARCRLCNADICEEHALCEAGGLIVTVEFRQLQAGQPRKPPRGAVGALNYDRVGDPNTAAVAVCADCTHGLQSSTAETNYRKLYVGALPAIVAHVVETLQAALAANAMGKGRDNEA